MSTQARPLAQRPRQLRRQIASVPHSDLVKSQPGCHRVQFRSQGVGDPGRLLTGFGERADDVQRITGAFGLQVDAADEVAIE